MTDDLFASDKPATSEHVPLAERMRPASLAEVVGQHHLTDDDAPIGRMLARGRASSIIFQGPPGTGKTTMARIIADTLGLQQRQISAVTTGIADLRKIVAEAQQNFEMQGKPLVLFVDEIHRWAKNVMDGLLGPMESGAIVLIAATTENVGFSVQDAVISRSNVYETFAITSADLEKLVDRVEAAERPLPITAEARKILISNAAGDARFLLGQLESLLDHDGPDLDVEAMERLLSKRLAKMDKGGDGHYDLASAFQKSVRGSDCNAALFYAAKMIDAGEDPMFLLRRLMVTASEEVGMADPAALQTVVAARDAYHMIGLPEAGYAISQAVIHVATAPKSNASYKAWGAAMAAAKASRGVSPPKDILNAPTKLMQDQGRKKSYLYDHDYPGAFSGQNFWPTEVGRLNLYQPSDRGIEPRIKQRMDHWDQIRKDHGTY